MIHLLPIGTVVKLSEKSDIKFMIVGYLPQNEQGERRDYSAIRYPMGVYDSRMYFFFNESDVTEILHRGYEDDEFHAMESLFEASNLSFEKREEK